MQPFFSPLRNAERVARLASSVGIRWAVAFAIKNWGFKSAFNLLETDASLQNAFSQPKEDLLEWEREEFLWLSQKGAGRLKIKAGK